MENNSSVNNSLGNFQPENTPNITPPQIQSSPSDALITPFSQKKPSFVLPLILSLIFLLTVLIFGTTSYAIAYQKITVPKKFENVQFTLTNFVQSLPFTPKTPEFLIAKALLAQEKINKESYDVSVALDSGGTSLIPGMDSTIDLAAKGKIDYSDSDNIRFTVDAYFTKDFNFQIFKPDNLLYFKVNKVPSLLLSFTGMTPQDFESVIGKWFYYDTTPLSTEAREEMEKSGDKEVFSDKFVKETLDSYIDAKLLSAMKVTDDAVDNFPVYKISIVADSNLIDHIGKIIEEKEKSTPRTNLDTLSEYSEKLSDIVKALTWEVSIDKKSYYVRKVVVTTKIEVDEIQDYNSLFGNPTIPQQKTSANLAFATKFSDFGSAVNIEKPSDAKSWEDFTDAISEIFARQYSTNTNSSVSRAIDAKTKSDIDSIRTALEMYKADCGNYPKNLLDMTHTAGSENCLSSDGGIYINEIPTSSSGLEYYYKASVDLSTYYLCASLEIVDENSNNCPNPTYNYGISSP